MDCIINCNKWANTNPNGVLAILYQVYDSHSAKECIIALRTNTDQNMVLSILYQVYDSQSEKKCVNPEKRWWKVLRRRLTYIFSVSIFHPKN